MSRAAIDDLGRSLPTVFRPGVIQNVTFSGTSAQSASFGAGTSVVRLAATAACWVCFAADTATASNSVLLPAGIDFVAAVTPGSKVAALQVSAGGTLNITEMG